MTTDHCKICRCKPKPRRANIRSVVVGLLVVGVLAIDLGLQAPPEPGISLSRGSLHVYPITLLRDWDITLLHPVIERLAVFNLGERLSGLRGMASLLPVLVLGGGLGVAGSRVAGRLDEEDAVRAD